MVSSPVPPSRRAVARLVAPYAERLVGADFPALPADRRRLTVAFVTRRVAVIPSFAAVGVAALAVVFRTVLLVPFGWQLTRAVTALPVPFVPEYPRLVRSLAVAYIWETWPDTAPDGAEIERGTGDTATDTTATWTRDRTGATVGDPVGDDVEVSS
jgi:hypothetical protein